MTKYVRKVETGYEYGYCTQEMILNKERLKREIVYTAKGIAPTVEDAYNEMDMDIINHPVTVKPIFTKLWHDY
jgi:hypothetical protein